MKTLKKNNPPKPAPESNVLINGSALHFISHVPIGDLLVELYFGSQDTVPAGSARTDDNGNFTIELRTIHLQHILADGKVKIRFETFSKNSKVTCSPDGFMLAIDSGQRAYFTLLVTPAASDPGNTFSFFPLAGQAVNATTGYPLAGALVRVYSCETNPENPLAASKDELLLGETATKAEGLFTMVFNSTRQVWKELQFISATPGVVYYMKVFSDTNELLFATKPLTISDGFSVQLSVPIPFVPGLEKNWTAVVEKMKSIPGLKVKDIVYQLTSVPQAESMIKNLDLLARHSLVRDMEQAFLDPDGHLRRTVNIIPSFKDLQDPATLETLSRTIEKKDRSDKAQLALGELAGKVKSFSNLSQIDWLMGEKEFVSGDIAGAININKDRYVAAQVDLPFAVPETDLSRYRDYLREIWLNWIVKVNSPTGAHFDRADAIRQLNTRFHQNFFSTDTRTLAANELMIPIIVQFLTSPKANGQGYGIAAAAIPSRGSLSPRQYIDLLVGLAGVSLKEFGLRCRIKLTRADAELSNMVQENVYTLQDFFRDSFECGEEPFHVAPDVLDQPMIPESLQGKGPFYLQYEEWLRQQQPFYPENFYDVRRAYPIGPEGAGLSQAELDKLTAYTNATKLSSEIAEWKIYADVLDIYKLIKEGNNYYYLNQYTLASLSYQRAAAIGDDMLREVNVYDIVKKLRRETVVNFDETAQFKARKGVRIDSMDDLIAYENAGPYTFFQIGITERNTTLQKVLADFIYYYLFTIPACLADTAMALGDYPSALRFAKQLTYFDIGLATLSTPAGTLPPVMLEGELNIGDLPYTVNLSDSDIAYQNSQMDITRQYHMTLPFNQRSLFIKKYMHPMEVKHFRIRQGDIMLAWADSLFRTADNSSILRARELYKAVLWMYNVTPPIAPNWPGLHQPFGGPIIIYKNSTENPLIASQKSRAQLGFYKIANQLNYYGERSELVPSLRYQPLKETAGRFTALAKMTQQDFLLYTEKTETGIMNKMKIDNLIKKSTIQSKLADEQIKVAADNVTLAQDQVKKVEDAITAKQKEISDDQDLFKQFSNFAKGVKSAFDSAPDDTKSTAVSGYKSEIMGKNMVGEGMLGLGAGASMLTGFGIFVYAGISSMKGMEEAGNAKMRELADLRDKALPTAKLVADSKIHEQNIAQLQKQIAQADLNFAQDILYFEDNRFLNINFWSSLAILAKKIMQRYLELGARAAWLAERALAYQQNRTIEIIRFDYFPEKLQGVTGADLLEADLTELEAIRVEGTRLTVPIKRTFSIARDFPAQFGELKQTGRCNFKTEELAIQQAYPGTFGYRIRAVSITTSSFAQASAYRGILVNQGISILNPNTANAVVSVRPSEGLPVSEFKLQNDMALYGLPDETLLTFEGSGIETFWDIHFSRSANQFGMESLIDVLLTVDMHAEFSQDLFQQQLLNPPTSTRQWMLVSARQFQSAQVQAFITSPGKVSVSFDLTKIGLSSQEKDRKVKNMMIIFTGIKGANFNTMLSSTKPAAFASTVAVADGVAVSNIPISGMPAPLIPSPLNGFEDVPFDQVFTITVNKTTAAGIDFTTITDIILGVEYAADLV